MAEQQPQVVLPKTERLIEIKVAETQIRSYMGDKWPVLATAKAGEKFPVLSRTRSGWYQIAFHNQFGYIPVKDARLLPLAKSEKAAAQQEAAAALPVSEEAPPLQTTAPPPPATEKSKFPTTWVLVGVLAVVFVVILVVKSARETHELEDRLRHK
jgi:hypothetical protein